MDTRGGTVNNENAGVPAKILVIDGENDHCRLFKEELEDDGYQVFTAMTWTEGMDIFMKETPDVVTLDVCMTDCEERLKMLGKMKQAKPGMAIILLTAYDYHDDFDAPHVDACVIKSSDLSELKSAIKAATISRCSA